MRDHAKRSAIHLGTNNDWPVHRADVPHRNFQVVIYLKEIDVGQVTKAFCENIILSRGSVGLTDWEKMQMAVLALRALENGLNLVEHTAAAEVPRK